MRLELPLVPLIINHAPGGPIAQVWSRSAAWCYLQFNTIYAQNRACGIMSPTHKVTNPKRKLHLSKS